MAKKVRSDNRGVASAGPNGRGFMPDLRLRQLAQKFLALTRPSASDFTSKDHQPGTTVGTCPLRTVGLACHQPAGDQGQLRAVEKRQSVCNDLKTSLVMGTPGRQVEITDLHVECDPAPQLPCTLAPQHTDPTSHTLTCGGQACPAKRRRTMGQRRQNNNTGKLTPQTPPKFHETNERKKERNMWQEREKNEILGSPPFGPPTRPKSGLGQKWSGQKWPKERAKGGLGQKWYLQSWLTLANLSVLVCWPNFQPKKPKPQTPRLAFRLGPQSLNTQTLNLERRARPFGPTLQDPTLQGHTSTGFDLYLHF